MKVHELKIETTEPTLSSDEEFGIPIDLSDILSVCKQYNKLGWKIQSQVECLLDIGVDEAVKQGIVKVESLPHIKDFLNSICNNVYFGDAVNQASNCIALIDYFEMKAPSYFNAAKN